CQAEGIKQLFNDDEILSIIEIGGEDSKFIQLNRGILSDYNMNPVCAAGTGTFLENLAELLGVNIKEEFSEKAFAAEYGVDLGDICTLISQSILASASARGLPLNEQLASLAYSSARNYLSKTVDKRPLTGRLVFAGATAKNHALASALAAICEERVYVPPRPELTGALGSALMARQFHQLGIFAENTFKSLSEIREFTNTKSPCKAECKHEHNCMLNIISFADGKKFIYGDRCGRYSSRENRKSLQELPDYGQERMELMESAAELKAQGNTGPTVGLAQGGLYYDYYPFWSTFLSSLGCNVIRSNDTNAETLQKGKLGLDSEMCYPMKVIVGHYAELKEMDLDYIFLPEVVDMEALPWAESWPRSFVCPLLQTLHGTIVNSINLDPDKVIYAKLNYRSGLNGIREQLLPVAKKILGKNFSKDKLNEALQSAFAVQEQFRKKLVKAAETMLSELEEQNDRVAVAFLSRSYTLYDHFISKKSMYYARISGMMAIPHEYLFDYLQAWHNGEIKSKYLDPYREEFIAYLKEQVARLNNVYPTQLQKILSSVLLINFLNEKCSNTKLPPINMVLLDPFKCGPNAMMRHFLSGLTNYLRLTLDEHTAAAGMITRLEAFRNTCLSKSDNSRHESFTSSTRSVAQNDWQKILIPEPTYHSDIFAAMFRGYGVDAKVIPRGKNGDLSLAQRYVNGEECLPFIQNLQDYLSYLQNNGDTDSEGTVFFQGWACGPCRYGLYAPVQSLAIERAGYGKERVLSVKLQDVIKRFGYGFVIGLYSGLMAMDLLYKMLHRTRPYELEPGRAEAIFEKYRHKLFEILENSEFKLFTIFTGKYRQPLEKLIRDAANEFNRIKTNEQVKPVIILNGEFYVRLDERCNQSVINKIEAAGGEVSTAPATELFTYTIYVMHLEAKQEFILNRKPGEFIEQMLYRWLLNIALRDEHALEEAAGELLAGYEEPAPKEIMEGAVKYVSSHYGGEPPMTIGRAAAFANRDRVAGAVFVAPFTCMPGSIVEAQQRSLQDELNIPIITVYYDGQNNANRDEMVEGLVFQAKQKLKLKQKQPGLK
ncbi:MAG: acyl-CoA dehydratase activase-related protein, partial [Bacillota bacterium]